MNPQQIASDLAVKRTLRQSWNAFFGAFGRLTEAQRRAMPPIYQGKNVLLCAPTASGKTEAMFAPICERLLSTSQGDGPDILYVAPTRALVKDAYRRVEGPLERLGLTVLMRTGDHRQFTEQRRSNVVMTTPESFDSMICRMPELIRKVGWVIVDEIHLLANSYRGDQIVFLLRRLQALKGRPVQIVAASATIADSREVARRFLGESSDVVSVDTSSRGVEMTLIGYEEACANLGQVLWDHGAKKVLVFVNGRAHAEKIGSEMNDGPFRNKVMTHHSGLSRTEREETEQQFSGARSGLCVATSTLEIGIDVGDIDVVVNWDPPTNPSSFLQRIGRGNRRSRTVSTYCVCRTSVEVALYKTLLRHSLEGRIVEDSYKPAASVLLQQVASLLFQHRDGLTLESISHMLGASASDLEDKLAGMFDSGLLTQLRGGVLVLGEKADRLTAFGRLHSNIEDDGEEYEVADLHTSSRIGFVSECAPRYILSGKTWAHVETKGRTIWVRLSGDTGIPPSYDSRASFAGYSFDFAQEVKKMLWPSLGPTVWVMRHGDGEIHLQHFMGGINGIVIAKSLQRRTRGLSYQEDNRRVWAKPDPLGFAVQVNRVPEELLAQGASLVAWMHTDGASLGRAMNMGAFYRYLPEHVKKREVLNRIQVEVLGDVLGHLAIIEEPPRPSCEVPSAASGELATVGSG